jgi:hypothetical protein
MKLTYLVDCAGRVARDPRGAESVTAAGICLPSGALKHIRCRLPRQLPKWRDASDDDLLSVVSLLRQEAFCAVGRVVRKKMPAWETFWSDAEKVHARVVALSGQKLPFIKAATQIRYGLFAEVTATLAGCSISTNRFPSDRAGWLQIDETHIYDAEIEGEDNVSTFREIWGVRNANQPLAQSMRLRMEAREIHFANEQDEPLLLLPDYVAGLVHWAHSQADTLSASRISHDAARTAYAALRTWPGFQDFQGDFDLDYFHIFPAFTELVETALDPAARSPPGANAR